MADEDAMYVKVKDLTKQMSRLLVQMVIHITMRLSVRWLSWKVRDRRCMGRTLGFMCDIGKWLNSFRAFSRHCWRI